MIAIQNVEEELGQPLVNLLALNKNVLILIHFVLVSLIVKSVNVFVLWPTDICVFSHSLLSNHCLFKYLCSKNLISINTYQFAFA